MKNYFFNKGMLGKIIKYMRKNYQKNYDFEVDKEFLNLYNKFYVINICKLNFISIKKLFI